MKKTYPRLHVLIVGIRSFQVLVLILMNITNVDIVVLNLLKYLII